MTKLYKQADTSNHKILNISDWAKATLSPDEYAEFKEAERRNNNLMLEYQNAGLIQMNSIKETCWSNILNEEVILTTGLEIMLSPGVTILDIPIDPEWGMWEARYAADPDVNYNPMYQE